MCGVSTDMSNSNDPQHIQHRPAAGLLNAPQAHVHLPAPSVAELLCLVATGVCGTVPEAAQRVSVTYVTDPICSACWAMEPAWRAVEYTYGDRLDVRHVYGGLLPSGEGFLRRRQRHPRLRRRRPPLA